MKIGILTFPGITCEGCVLQMYALHRSVVQTGAEVIMEMNKGRPAANLRRAFQTIKNCWRGSCQRS